MRLRGFLVILLLVLVLAYFLWVLKTGDKEKITEEIEAFNRVKERVTKTNMSTLERAIAVFVAQNGRTPQTLKEVRMFSRSVYAESDAWGTALKYKRISEDRFRLSSAGKDKVFDTRDDIVIEK